MVGRRAVLVVALLVLVTIALTGTIGLAAPAEDPADRTPGEQFGGLIGVQDAELAGDLDDRRFEHRLARADTDAERASIVAERTDHVTERIDELETRLVELETARADGEVRPGQYGATVAVVEAERVGLERAAERNAAIAEELPAPARQEAGVDVGAVRAQHDRAGDLGRSESAAIAADVAGQRAGEPPAGDRGGGPPDDVPGRSTD